MNQQKQPGEQLKVRLKPPVHQWLKTQSKAQERSMSWLINTILEQAKRVMETKHEPTH